ncbi:MAG: YceI family protein [Acidiferrobacterales bacterium]
MSYHRLSSVLKTATLCLGLAVLMAPVAEAATYHVANGSPAGTYRIDPDHSLAWFTIGHAGVAVVTGRFDKMSGTYTVDPADAAKDRVSVRIAASSLDTNLAARDHDLQGPDFFNVREFPDIDFAATHFRSTGSKTGLLYGRLTMRGVTRAVVFHVREIGAGPVTALPKPWGGYLSGYEGTATLRRSKFGMGAYAGMIGDVVRLHVNIEGVRTSK